ncbi:MAG: nitroreductase family protein [Planctomycetales bacterium]|nr:nitroreductase family protein [Planctomycetales bacterium]
MDTFEAIETRRSVKHFDADYEMPAEDMRRLLSLALLSPTSFNIQNWRFINVRDRDLRSRIREAAWDQAQVTEASMLLVLCGDLRAYAEDPWRYWRNAPEAAQQMIVPAIENFYQGRPQVQRDEVMRSCGIAAQTLMLAARAMGYDSNPMIGFDAERVGELVALPADHVVAMMLVIGKATKPARPRGGQLPIDEVVFGDRFPTVT